MGRLKNTPDQQIEARIKNNKRKCEWSKLRRQENLKALLEGGASYVKKCDCGKYFDERMQGALKNENMKGAKRLRCMKCPLKPKEDFRKTWSKRDQKWVLRKR